MRQLFIMLGVVAAMALATPAVAGQVQGPTCGGNPPPCNGFAYSDYSKISPSDLIVSYVGGAPKSNTDPNFPGFPAQRVVNHGGGCDRRSTWTPPRMGKSGDAGVRNGCVYLLFDWSCTTTACSPEGHLNTPNPILGAPTNPKTGNVVRLGFAAIGHSKRAMETLFAWTTCQSNYAHYARGMPIFTNAQFVTAIDRGSIPLFTYTYTSGTYDVPGTDVDHPTEYVVLPKNRACDAVTRLNTHLVEIDEERADGISGGSLVKYLREVSKILNRARYKLVVRADELGGSNATFSGFNKRSIPKILALPDVRYFYILLWSGNRQNDILKSWAYQVAMANGGTTPPPCSRFFKKIGVRVQLSDLNPSDWANVNKSVVVGDCVNYLEAWPNKSRLGGDNCYGGEPVLNPQKWAAGWGYSFGC